VKKRLFRDDPRRQCRGKRAYDTKATAKKVLRDSQGLRGRGRLRPYACPHCGLWHIGHKPDHRDREAEEA
jgi:hypothetical protein